MVLPKSQVNAWACLHWLQAISDEEFKTIKIKKVMDLTDGIQEPKSNTQYPPTAGV